jgi:cytochrome P450
MLEIKMALAVLLGRFDIENVTPARRRHERAKTSRSRCRPSR